MGGERGRERGEGALGGRDRREEEEKCHGLDGFASMLEGD